MKRIFLFGLMAVMIAACSGGKKIVKITASGDKENNSDSVQYELETFDTRFETWFKLHDNPAEYRSQEYYESWNKQYVAAWDYNSRDPARADFFQPIIGWQPNVDYGFKLNHKLFYYFMYVEHVLKVRILPGGGPQTY